MAAPDIPVEVNSIPMAPPDRDAGDADEDPAMLPQTHEVPRASGPAFEQRVRDLWEAIVFDNPDQAMTAFFPLAAYVKVKDVDKPAVDWKRRLVAAYVRDIHALHHRLERQTGDSGRATFVGFDVPEAQARWVSPGEEYNKIGYFRVFGSRVRYEVGEAFFTIEVKSLISWRGNWYVVHLRSIE